MGRILTELDDILTTIGSGPTGLDGRLDLLESDRLTVGQGIIPRSQLINSNITLTSQALRLTYFTATKSETVASVRILVGGTAAGATPTLIRYGLYTAAADGAGTLVASTANDTTLLATPSVSSTKALSAPYAVTAGVRYALGLLVVTAATAPTVFGMATLDSAEAAMAPRLNGVIGSQADLPASFAAGSVASSSFRAYAALLP